MNFIIPAIIGFVTLTNISSYFVMASRTPQFTRFLGTVHYPLDYLYYLSFITQGRWHWLRSYHLFTGETTHLEFLNWPYVLFGHIGSMFGLNAPVIFQIMVVVGTLLYLVVAYRIAELLIPKNASARLMLYVLFLISNAFPNIYTADGHWVFYYFFPFENWGQPFIRLTNVPHHLFIQAGIMAAFFLSLKFWKHQLSLQKTMVFAAATGLVLASMQPLQWAFVTGVLGLTSLYAWWKTGKITALVPPVLLGIGGLVPALYLKHLFTFAPYTNTIAWENNQQIYISFRHLVELNGPLMLIAIIGLPFVLLPLSAGPLFLILYTVLAAIIFFSPLPALLHMMNNRFFSVIPTFAFAFISTEFLWKLAGKADKKRVGAFAWFAALLVMAITFPVTLHHVDDRMHVAGTDDVMAYLPLGAYQAFVYARDTVGPTDIVLAEPLFSQPFVAVSGKHVFVSNELASIDYTRKIAETTDFFTKPQPDDRKIAWLRKNHIAYIFTYAWTPINLPNLTVAYQNKYSLFYKVN